MQMTAPYTPQQNGRAERKNRYLTEMTRSMLIDANMPNKYWGEALLTANHLQNRLPTSGEYMLLLILMLQHPGIFFWLINSI